MDKEHGPEQYSFLQEVIKDEKPKRGDFIKKVAKLVGKGLLFGVAASIGFFALKPWVEDDFYEDAGKVEIPEDEEKEEAALQEEARPEERELTIENYRELSSALKDVVREAKKSVVSVTGIKQDEGWLTGDADSYVKTFGVIIADNGRELLILTNYSSIEAADLFRVTFADGSEHEAVRKQEDGNSDMAIFSVAKSGISDATWANIKQADLGNSNALIQGETIIALGSPFGYDGSIGYGIVGSANEKMTIADSEYRLVVTDMPGTDQSGGFLFNISGSVVGVIEPECTDEAQILVGIGISSVKSEIELMSNGQNVPYIGVLGTGVTESVSEARGIPAGLYVTEVEVDSPAMKAGIQSGDIIVEVDNEEIMSMADYHEEILNQEAGQIIKIKGYRRGAENYVDIDFNVTVGIKQ